MLPDDLENLSSRWCLFANNVLQFTTRNYWDFNEC